MKSIFFFDSMLTPKIITLVYWVALFFIVIYGFSVMTAFGHSRTGSILSGLGIIIGGGVGARIWCELLIVLFKIHENTKIIADKNS